MIYSISRPHGGLLASSSWALWAQNTPYVGHDNIKTIPHGYPTGRFTEVFYVVDVKIPSDYSNTNVQCNIPANRPGTLPLHHARTRTAPTSKLGAGSRACTRISCAFDVRPVVGTSSGDVVRAPGTSSGGFKGDPYMKSRVAVHYMLGINHSELI